MGLKRIGLLLFLSSQSLLAAEPIDILFNREATYEQRVAAQKELGDKTLSTFNTAAELCYDIDLCAQETAPATVAAACEQELMQDNKDGYVSAGCVSTVFRKKSTCSTTVPKLTNTALEKNITLMRDVEQIYNGRMYDLLVNFFSQKYPEIEPIKESMSELAEYLEQNPEIDQEIKSFSDGTMGLAQYTMNCYGKINPILFKNDRQNMTRHFNFIKSTIDTMLLLPTYKGKVNRGTSLPPAVLAEHLKVGNTVCNKGFTSTAVHHPSDYTDKPRNIFLSDPCSHRLYINYEDNGAQPGRRIDRYSASPGENEVLFEPGACFKINQVKPTSKAKTAELCEGSNQIYDIEMTLVPSASK